LQQQDTELESDKPSFWFAVKRYGWGWGLPVRWQGWLVLALYFAVVVLGIFYLHPENDPARFLAFLVIATLILMAIVAWKGEKPVGWRWGRK
jgi:hypothetical protein